MQASEIIQLMQQNRQPTLDLLPDLELLTAEFPWFSIAYQLRLKVLKAFDEELFLNQLPATAARTVNRGQLYSYLFIEKKLNSNEDELGPIFYYQPDEAEIPTSDNDEDKEVDNSLDLPDIPTEAPTDYFLLEEEINTDKKVTVKKEDLLEKFISANPKITPRKQEEKQQEEVRLSDSTEGIASETLAQIYIDQKFYDKALAVYKELSLQNPEKRAYFAALIKKVKEEIK